MGSSSEDSGPLAEWKSRCLEAGRSLFEYRLHSKLPSSSEDSGPLTEWEESLPRCWEIPVRVSTPFRTSIVFRRLQSADRVGRVVASMLGDPCSSIDSIQNFHRLQKTPVR